MSRSKKQNGLTWRWVSIPIPPDAISKVEKFGGVSFPEDYVQCVYQNNGGRPNLKVFVVPGRGEAVFSHLLSFMDATQRGEDQGILQMYNLVKDRLPARVFPFAADPFGNLLCFDYRNEKDECPTIVFWDHEKAFTNIKRAVTPVCKSFSYLIEGLYDLD